MLISAQPHQYQIPDRLIGSDHESNSCSEGTVVLVCHKRYSEGAVILSVHLEITRLPIDGCRFWAHPALFYGRESSIHMKGASHGDKKTQQAKRKHVRPASSIVWFEVPADDLRRAKQFYRSLFGWKFQKLPAPINEYWHIDTGGKEDSPDGGMMPRVHPNQSITKYISVASVEGLRQK